MKHTLTLLAALFAALSLSAQDLSSLAKEFQTPPPTARPGVYWYFMDGNLSKESITKDLQAMHDVGIGYVLFLEVNVGVPRGKVDFMSDEWMDIFRHAVSECERFGIQMTLGIGPGWTGSGGPWVKGEQSMQHLVASTVKVTGGKQLDIKLDTPAANPPFFGEGAFTPKMKQDWLDYYQDVVTLAFPTPPGDDRIADVKEKALYVRAPFSSQPGVKQYLPAVYGAATPDASSIDKSSIIDVTEYVAADGRLVWNAPEGEWTIMRFGSRNNGAATRPAPIPGVGMECDKFDSEALKAHLAHFTDKLFATLGERPKAFGGLKYLHMDSWEMGAQNWTAKFREEFMRRRGYDPQPYYPVYTGLIVGNSLESERFLYDVRLTAQELTIENHALAVKEYAHAHDLLLSIEPYDMNPTADLELAVAADIPMAEFWSDGFGFNTSFSPGEGTSAAHLLGQPVVPAESFTSEGDGWRQYPGLLKNQTDWAFSAGINRLVFHTFQHQDLPDSLRPGMTMGPYGVHWDRNQTWWPMSVAYHTFIARSQNMLQQGRTVADILYLVPESIPHAFKAPDSAYDKIGTFMPDRKAYNFDGCPPSMIYKAEVRNGKVVFPSGATYSILVLPEYKTATPELLAKVLSLVKAGATVVGSAPVSSPSLMDYPNCDKKVASLAKKIWGKKGEAVRKVGKGKVILFEGQADNLYQPYPQTAEILASMGVAPDMVASSGNVRYTHRTLDGSEIYYVSNRTAKRMSDVCSFRVSGMKAELWDPMTGERKVLSGCSDNGTVTSVPLVFDQYQSFFVVFSKSGSGIDASADFSKGQKDIMTVSSPWTVSFDPKWGKAEPVTFETLVDWTTSDDPLVKYYSGTAVYETSFAFSGDPTKATAIDLGKVCYLAHVFLNGKDLGITWAAPFKLDLSGALVKGENNLRIEVVNLWQNRVVGDLREPDGKQYTFHTWRHYKATDPILESGLLGPVRIME